jgi:hypothetical protein
VVTAVHTVTWSLLLQWTALGLLFLPAMLLGRPIGLLVIGLGLPTPLVVVWAAVFYSLLLAGSIYTERVSWVDRKIQAVEADRWVAPCVRLHPGWHIPMMVLLAPITLSNFGSLLFVRQAAGVWRWVLGVAYVIIMTLAYHFLSGLPVYVLAMAAPLALAARLATSAHERRYFRLRLLAWGAAAAGWSYR